jgi:hypothetical protein
MWPVLSVGTLQQYLTRLKKEYRRMMTMKPDMSEWYYDKNRSIIKTFSILKEALVKSKPDSLRLLTLTSFFAAGNIPIIMMDHIHRTEDVLPKHLSLDDQDSAASNGQESEIFQWLNKLDHERCEQTIFALQKFCCLKVSVDKRGIRSFVIQDAIRRWCQEVLPPSEVEEWAILAAYRISQCTRPGDVSITTLKFLPHVLHIELVLF